MDIEIDDEMVVNNDQEEEKMLQDNPNIPTGSKVKHRFEILRKLGSGTYGKVSLAIDHKTGEHIALKIIRKNAIENPHDLLRIRREIRIMSALKHPNIIEIKEVFENDEKIIIVMEYADGGELYEYVSNHGPLGEEVVCRLFRQIVSAVFYCHKHGVVHRDLKLENILLDCNGTAKIADFGLSNYFEENRLLYTFCGSPLYASPEIINGVPYRGPEVDCWSLGVLLYTLAYSSMPFDGRDFNRMVRQIKKGTYYEPDPPSSASMLIRAMLRVNPERRADIDVIANHWWVNFDENSPPIHELPENQIIDSTPIHLRSETIVIQNFRQENDVFDDDLSQHHQSTSIRQKIEQFRKRREEAEDYFTISTPSTARPSAVPIETFLQNQTLQQNAPKFGTTPNNSSLFDEDDLLDPLLRLRNLENRLMFTNNKSTAQNNNINHCEEKIRRKSPTPPAQNQKIPTANNERKRSLYNNEDSTTLQSIEQQSLATANQEEANRLVNQLMEEAEKGAVSAQLIEKVRKSSAYEKQPFVKEIVDAMLDLQKNSSTGKKSSKKHSTTKMSKMARQNSRDQSEASIISLANELPDLIKNQTRSISQDVPPDIVINEENQQNQNAPRSLSRHNSNASDQLLSTTLKNGKLDNNDDVIVEEQDVDSTDFEDLDLEELDHIEKSSQEETQEEDQEVSPSDSFVTANDDGLIINSKEPNQTDSTVTDDYSLGLSKRQSRGKYERSKFIYEKSAERSKWLKTMDPDVNSSQELEKTATNTTTSSTAYKVLWPPELAEEKNNNVVVNGENSMSITADMVLRKPHAVTRTYEIEPFTMELNNRWQNEEPVELLNKHLSHESERKPKPRRYRKKTNRQISLPDEISINSTNHHQNRRKISEPFDTTWNNETITMPARPRSAAELDLLPTPKNEVSSNSTQDDSKLLSPLNHHPAPTRPWHKERSKSMHELSPDRAVLEALDYLRHNPDMAAERRKLRSWCAEPSGGTQRNMHDLQSPPDDPWLPMATAHPSDSHRSRGSCSRVYAPHPKFQVFQPKALSRVRAHSVERSHSGEEKPPIGYYGHLVNFTPHHHHHQQPQHQTVVDQPALKGILKKTTRYGHETYSEYPSRYDAQESNATDNYGRWSRNPISHYDETPVYNNAASARSDFRPRGVSMFEYNSPTHNHYDPPTRITATDDVIGVRKKKPLRDDRRKTTEIRFSDLTEAAHANANPSVYDKSSKYYNTGGSTGTKTNRYQHGGPAYDYDEPIGRSSYSNRPIETTMGSASSRSYTPRSSTSYTPTYTPKSKYFY